jgi:hypothetical protein
MNNQLTLFVFSRTLVKPGKDNFHLIVGQNESSHPGLGRNVRGNRSHAPPN